MLKLYLYAKFQSSRLKIEQVTVNLKKPTFFCFHVFWMQAVKTCLHAKFWTSSSKIERVREASNKKTVKLRKKYKHPWPLVWFGLLNCYFLLLTWALGIMKFWEQHIFLSHKSGLKWRRWKIGLKWRRWKILLRGWDLLIPLPLCSILYFF